MHFLLYMSKNYTQCLIQNTIRTRCLKILYNALLIKGTSHRILEVKGNFTNKGLLFFAN